MTADDINVQALFITEVQQACKRARASKKNVDLLKAAALIDSPRMDELNEWAQQDLLEGYTRTAAAVTGWVTP